MTKQTRLATLFALAAAVSGSEALSQTAEDLEQERARAWVRGDRAAIDAIIADDWSVIDISGRVRTSATGNDGLTVRLLSADSSEWQ